MRSAPRWPTSSGSCAARVPPSSSWASTRTLSTPDGGRRGSRALRYYAAAFDVVEAAGLADASLARAKAEEMFAREIHNVVAFEAADRFERHETFAGWRWRMQEGRFHNAGIGDREALQGCMIARMFAPGNYSMQGAGRWRGTHAPVDAPDHFRF
jgi:hypothetical protein